MLSLASDLEFLSAEELGPRERKPLKVSDSPERKLPLLPWRDPHSVSPEDLAQYITRLERLGERYPQSSEIRTCLGMAYAMNYDVHRSMDALERAVELDPLSFVAQLKYAELLYRIRAVPRAEQETLKALDLCREPWELALARRQLQEIRRLWREGTQKPAWTKPLLAPALTLLLFLAVVSLLMRMHP
ncbi:MAG TPA: hypothetical protein VN633_03565 [Bryobacteraceae bacterium]|nr:hypothetical protein [Bryobacteraceae bacterium]